MLNQNRILTLWSGNYAGGAGRRFVELTDGLVRRGAEVLVLTAHDYVGSSDLCVVPFPFGLHRFRCFRMALLRSYHYQVMRDLNQFNPNVVFCFGLANGGILCPAARGCGVANVLFVRGMELVLQNNRNIPFDHVPGVGNLTRSIYTQLFRVYSHKVFRQASGIVFQHEEQHQAYLRNKLIDADHKSHIFLLPNNSNASWLSIESPYKSQERPIAVIAANLFWNKGFRIALDAFRLVKIRVPKAGLIILGDGPQGYAIRRYARDMKGVEFKGHVEDVTKYLRSARLLVHPTLDESGSPNIVLEAAGLGVPFLVSDVVTHTVGSYPGVYPAQDSSRLAELWARTLKDDAFHIILCKASVTLGERFRFDWVARAQEILESVAQLGAKSNSKPL